MNQNGSPCIEIEIILSVYWRQKCVFVKYIKHMDDKFVTRQHEYIAILTEILVFTIDLALCFADIKTAQ